MIEKLQQLNEKLLTTCDLSDQKKYRLIKQLLTDKQCFFKMNIKTAYAILRDLGFQENELQDTYMALIDIKNL